MRKAWRDRVPPAIVRDFEALVRGGLGVALLLLLPATLFLTRETETSDRPARVLVAGAHDPRVTQRLVYVMRESSQLEVKQTNKAVSDPFASLKREGLDILLNYEGTEGHRSMYSAETDPRRLGELERIAAGIARAEVMITRRIADAGKTAGKTQPTELFGENWWARPDLYEDLFMLGPLPVNPLAEYFPQAIDPRAAAVPPLILLTVSLLPFALAAVLAVRTGGGVAPWSGWRVSALRTATAAVVPAAVTLFEVLAILLLAEWALDLHIKAGTVRMALLVLLAALASAFAGLAVVALRRTQVELAICCMVYVLLVVVLTASPLRYREGWVSIVAQVLPATHLSTVFTAWLFGAPYDVGAVWAAGRLLLLAAVLWFAAVVLDPRRAPRRVREAIPAAVPVDAV